MHKHLEIINPHVLPLRSQVSTGFMHCFVFSDVLPLQGGHGIVIVMSTVDAS